MHTKENKQNRVYYYEDELKDDFAGTKIKTKDTPKDFNYINNAFFFKIFAFWIYYLIAIPVVWIINKILYHMTFKNKNVLKKAKNQGYCLYANHVLLPGDAFTPGIITWPKKAYIVANPDAISIKGLKNIVIGLGAIPTPTNKETYINYIKAIETRLNQGSVITIYPEAHIWPYYNKIRDFTDVSFKFPIKNNVPSYCFTTIFKKRRIGKKPRAIVYIDGPFYSNSELNLKEQQKELRDRIFNTMTERVKESDYEYFHYEKILKSKEELL